MAAGRPERIGVYDTATGAEVWAAAGDSIHGVIMPGRDRVLVNNIPPHSRDPAFGWKVYDLRTNAVAAELPGGVGPGVASADGRVVVSHAADSSSDLLVWHLPGTP